MVNAMRVLFRADASLQIGTGHVMRCLTLADRLRDAGAAVTFACHDGPGNLLDFIEKRQFSVFTLCGHLSESRCQMDWERDAAQTEDVARGGRFAWLVVDHYSIDARWERRLRQMVPNVMVIDDLANRPHDCDLLLDQNFYPDMEQRYNELVPKDCRQFLGPHFALLRSEFYRMRRKARPRSQGVKRILISFGGADIDNQTSRALDAIELVLQRTRMPICVDVLLGAAFPHRVSLEERCSALSWATSYVACEHVGELMAAADLSLGAGGVTVWERCAVGLPALVITVATNQRLVVEALARRGCLVDLGPAEDVTTEAISGALESLLRQPSSLLELSERSYELLGPDLEVNAAKLTGALFA